MRLGVITAIILIAFATATPGFAGDDTPYIGSWDCGVAIFRFTKNTYDAGEGPMPIRTAEKEGGDYILSFDRDYRIGLSNVTKTSMQWLSLTSGDMLDCKRVKP